MTYGKFIAALVGAVLFAVQGALTDGVMSAGEWVTVVVAALAAIATAIVPNTDVAKYAKLWVNALAVTLAAVLVPALADGFLTNQELIALGIGVLTAAGVWAAPAPMHAVQA